MTSICTAHKGVRCCGSASKIKVISLEEMGKRPSKESWTVVTRRGRGQLVLKALIFDVDGTLADTERHGHRVAFNRALPSSPKVGWDEVCTAAYCQRRQEVFVISLPPTILTSRAAKASEMSSRICTLRRHATVALLETVRIPARRVSVGDHEIWLRNCRWLLPLQRLQKASMLCYRPVWCGRFRLVQWSRPVMSFRIKTRVFTNVLAKLSLTLLRVAFEDSENGFRSAPEPAFRRWLRSMTIPSIRTSPEHCL